MWSATLDTRVFINLLQAQSSELKCNTISTHQHSAGIICDQHPVMSGVADNQPPLIQPAQFAGEPEWPGGGQVGGRSQRQTAPAQPPGRPQTGQSGRGEGFQEVRVALADQLQQRLTARTWGGGGGGVSWDTDWGWH